MAEHSSRPPALRQTRRLVLAGAGHAHVEVLRAFGHNPEPGVAITLVTRTKLTPYSGMLPGLVAGLYGHLDAHIDASVLAARAKATFVLAEIDGIDVDAAFVRTIDGRIIPYDILSLDIGSTPADLVAGAREHALPVRPIDGFIARFDALLAQAMTDLATRDVSVAMVGAGAAGVELLFAIERRMRTEAASRGLDAGRLRFTLVSGSADILPGFPDAFREKLRAMLTARGVRIMAGAPVDAVLSDGLALAGGANVPADHVLWTTQASAAPWLRATGLARDADGFVRVEADLSCIDYPNVFAAGDVASVAMPGGGTLPRAGVQAVRAGPVLAANLRCALAGELTRSWHPQRHALVLLSTGMQHAVGTRNGLTASGRWVWQLKDWIDRRWMGRYR